MAVYISYIFSNDAMSQWPSSYILHKPSSYLMAVSLLSTSPWVLPTSPHLSSVQPAIIMLLPLGALHRHDVRDPVGITAEHNNDKEPA